MNQATMLTYSALVTTGNLHAAGRQPPRELTNDEAAAYVYCYEQRKRLEQEHLPAPEVARAIRCSLAGQRHLPTFTNSG